MSLSKSDIRKIESLFEVAGQKLLTEDRRRREDLSKLTKKRLYAYPQLKNNIERYRLDIESIKRETFGKSKSIVVFQRNSGSGEKPTLEDLRAAKIYLLEQRIERDETEIREMDAALKTIHDDPYYPALEMIFFQGMSHEMCASNVNCERSSITKNIGRLINVLNVVLYGAEALR